MGSLKAELRRFEKRRLRPVLRRLKPRRAETAQPTASNAAMEQLLAAMLRSEIRRAEPKQSVWSSLTATLQSRISGVQVSGSKDLENLVRTMLATPVPPAATDTGREAA